MHRSARARRHPDAGGVAMTGRRIMTADEIRRAVVRISHELVEKHGGTSGLALVGIQRRGVPLARRIGDAVFEHEGVRLPVGALDITFYRDDLSLIAQQPIVKGTDLPFDLNGSTVVLVDRGHRELPIRADHVGKNVPTSREEVVRVHLEETDGEDDVEIERTSDAPVAEAVG
jgi:pyrimidine operon attenuation protein/uracil phosphoribosyltransferase